MLYNRLTQGLHDKGRLIPITESVFDHIKQPEKDYYLSFFQYDESHRTEFLKTGTIAGITGLTTDRLVWDFDCVEQPELAKADAIVLIQRLISQNIDPKDLIISFSGQKGFGIEFQISQRLSSQEVKRLVYALAGDLKTFDGTIYNDSRVIRVCGTRHPATLLFKTPLTFKQLSMTLEAIRTLAKTEVDDNTPDFRWEIVDLPASLLALSVPAPAPVKLPVLDIDFNRKIKGWTNCKWALTQGYQVSEGDRNDKLLSIIATSKSLNYTKEQAYYTAKNASEQGVARNGGAKCNKEDIWAKVEYVYSDKWHGGAYSCRDGKTPWLTDLCKSLGTHRCKKEEETVFLKSNDLFETFYRFVINIEKNTIKTGIRELDANVMLTTSSLIGILGNPGSGKTTCALNILNTCNTNNIPTIFYSMDMGVPLIYLKLAQKHWGIPHKQVFDLVKNDKAKARELKALIDKEYSGSEMCFKTGLNVEEIRETIIHYNETRPERAKVVIIDYLECIAGPYSDATANTAIIANKLKDIALDTETCILLLLQTQKHAAAPDEPLLSMKNIKGSSVIEQACSVVITLWREGYSPKYAAQDKYISMATVKDRFNSLWKEDFKWDGLRGIISDLEDHERDGLAQLRASKAMDKSKVESSGLNF